MSQIVNFSYLCNLRESILNSVGPICLSYWFRKKQNTLNKFRRSKELMTNDLRQLYHKKEVIRGDTVKSLGSLNDMEMIFRFKLTLFIVLGKNSCFSVIKYENL